MYSYYRDNGALNSGPNAASCRDEFNAFVSDLIALNKIVCQNDLPDFYDPIEISLYTDKMDSYNFLSIYNFIMDPRKGYTKQFNRSKTSLMRRIIIIWLTRILEVPLLAEVIYTIGQVEVYKNLDKIEEREYMLGKTGKFKQLMEKYFDCILNEQSNVNPPSTTNIKIEKQ